LSSFETILVISTSGGGGESAFRFLLLLATFVGEFEWDSCDDDDKSVVYLILIKTQ